MNVQPIVEGHGEVSAAPVLLRRLRDQAGLYELDVNAPIRKKRAELVAEAGLRTAVRLALKQEDCSAILILFDSDDDCPGAVGPQVRGRAQQEAGQVPCRVVLAQREYEAWFLAAIASLRGTRGIAANARPHPQPEVPRDAKGQLEQRMAAKRSYAETADQPALTARFDLAEAHRRCRSFRHLVKAFAGIAVALGQALPNPWPPAGWEPEQG